MTLDAAGWNALVGHQDDCLIAITDGKPLPQRSLRALPPLRAVMIARVAVKAGVMPQSELDDLIKEARLVGGDGRLPIAKTSDRKDKGQRMKVFVATLMPFHDGSGIVRVIGVYSVKKRAEAHLFRALKALGFDQPTEIFEVILDRECNK